MMAKHPPERSNHDHYISGNPLERDGKASIKEESQYNGGKHIHHDHQGGKASAIHEVGTGSSITEQTMAKKT